MRHTFPAVTFASILTASALGAAAAPPPPAASPAPTSSPSLGRLPADPAARVDALADAYVRVYFEHFPDQATAQGRADADNARLPDNSLAGLDAWRDEEDALLDELDTVERARLTGRAVVIHDFLRELLEASIGARVCET